VWRDSTERPFSRSPVAPQMMAGTGQLGISRRGSAVRQSSGHGRAGSADRATVLERAPDKFRRARSAPERACAPHRADRAATWVREAPPKNSLRGTDGYATRSSGVISRRRPFDADHLGLLDKPRASPWIALRRIVVCRARYGHFYG
jgi:hypothetical protein